MVISVSFRCGVKIHTVSNVTCGLAGVSWAKGFDRR